jgi:hypothetical protein
VRGRAGLARASGPELHKTLVLDFPLQTMSQYLLTQAGPIGKHSRLVVIHGSDPLYVAYMLHSVNRNRSQPLKTHKNLSQYATCQVGAKMDNYYFYQ